MRALQTFRSIGIVKKAPPGGADRRGSRNTLAKSRALRQNGGLIKACRARTRAAEAALKDKERRP
jgi:hypothetical protein